MSPADMDNCRLNENNLSVGIRSVSAQFLAVSVFGLQILLSSAGKWAILSFALLHNGFCVEQQF
jgi:hypothetical protein